MHHFIYRIAYTMAFVTPVVEYWLDREIAQWVHQEGGYEIEIKHTCLLLVTTYVMDDDKTSFR